MAPLPPRRPSRVSALNPRQDQLSPIFGAGTAVGPAFPAPVVRQPAAGSSRVRLLEVSSAPLSEVLTQPPVRRFRPAGGRAASRRRAGGDKGLSAPAPGNAPGNARPRRRSPHARRPQESHGTAAGGGDPLRPGRQHGLLGAGRAAL